MGGGEGPESSSGSVAEWVWPVEGGDHNSSVECHGEVKVCLLVPDHYLSCDPRNTGLGNLVL